MPHPVHGPLKLGRGDLEDGVKFSSSLPGNADSDPLDESDAADALLLDAPIDLTDAAAHGRGTGTTPMKNSEFPL